MQSWPRKGDFQNLVEWGEVESVSALLKETIERLKLGPNEEWIQEVILEAAEELPRSIKEGQESEYAAEFILGVSAARNSLVIASYCFRFLKAQDLMDGPTADEVDWRLDQLEQKLSHLTERLRGSLRDQYKFSSN
jgi:23S rRNA-intervening sequence protein